MTPAGHHISRSNILKSLEQALGFPAVEAAPGELELTPGVFHRSEPGETETKVVANDSRPRVVARQRPETGERLGRIVLVEASNGSGDPSRETVGLQLEGAEEGLSRRYGPARTLVRRAKEEPVTRAA